MKLLIYTHTNSIQYAENFSFTP